jgi:hypothetical protein
MQPAALREKRLQQGGCRIGLPEDDCEPGPEGFGKPERGIRIDPIGKQASITRAPPMRQQNGTDQRARS